MLSLMKNQGINPTNIKVKKSKVSVSTPKSILTAFKVLIPAVNANQYTKIVNAGLITAQRGPITAPLYVFISSFLARRNICLPKCLCSFKIVKIT